MHGRVAGPLPSLSMPPKNSRARLPEESRLHLHNVGSQQKGSMKPLRSAEVQMVVARESSSLAGQAGLADSSAGVFQSSRYIALSTLLNMRINTS
jgi:hypothetical protein